MIGSTDGRPPDGTPTERAGRRARRVAVAWIVVVAAASLVDPAALLDLIGTSPTAGAGGAGGTGAFVAAHLVAYGVLAWLLVGALGLDARDPQAVLAAIAVAAAVGVGVELLQAPVAARTASAADALVNAIGAAAGAALRAAVAER